MLLGSNVFLCIASSGALGRETGFTIGDGVGGGAVWVDIGEGEPFFSLLPIGFLWFTSISTFDSEMGEGIGSGAVGVGIDADSGGANFSLDNLAKAIS